MTPVWLLWAGCRQMQQSPANGVPHDIKVYPEASHGFLNDHPTEDLTPPTVVLSKLSWRSSTGI